MAERKHETIVKTFKNILSDAKEALNTRANFSSGTHYVKGKGGYTRRQENPFSGLKEYSSDPNKE